MGVDDAEGRPAIPVDLGHAGLTGAVEVGRSTYGVFFRCIEDVLGRAVTVKLLCSDLDPYERERFFHEGRAMGRISGHPNVVEVLQVGLTPSGRPYLVMPVQSLDSLAARVQDSGPFAWHDAIRIGVHVAGALESVHRASVLHRNIQPDAILLTDCGVVQLAGFDIARINGSEEETDASFIGSMAYAPPEVLNGRPPSRQADIYGLAATLFSIIAGRAAFERKPGEELINQFLRITGPQIPNLREYGAPDELCTIIEQAMSQDPLRRPSSASEFGHNLQRVQRGAGLPMAEMTLQRKAGLDQITHHRPSAWQRTSIARDSPDVATASGESSAPNHMEAGTENAHHTGNELIFLCHSSGDKLRVRELYQRLMADNINCWFDEEDLLPGQNWDYEIGQAIRRSRFVLACLSRSSVTRRGYVQKELKRAVDVAEEQPEGVAYLIPVRLEECQMPPGLSRWQWVDLFESEGYKRLLQGLRVGLAAKADRA